MFEARVAPRAASSSVVACSLQLSFRVFSPAQSTLSPEAQRHVFTMLGVCFIHEQYDRDELWQRPTACSHVLAEVVAAED